MVDKALSNQEEEEEVVIYGVPSTYEDLYRVMLFLLLVYLAGDVLCQRVFRIVPALVGHMAAGMAFGSQGLQLLMPFGHHSDKSLPLSLPLESTFVLLGNVGLV
jgi:hypothetical protein